MVRWLAYFLVMVVTFSEGLGQSITTIIGAEFPTTGSSNDPIRPRGFLQKSAHEFLILDGSSFLWKMDQSGNLTRILGSGVLGQHDTNDNPLTADLSLDKVAVSPGGEIFFVDGNQIKKISAATGKIVLVAGTAASGFGGDNGPATQAAFGYPTDIEFGPGGNLYICDDDNRRIRKVDLATQIVTTVAGNGNDPDNGNNIPATSAGIWPFSITFDPSGNLIFADYGKIRKVVGGTISTLAGDGNPSSTGDNGPATAAQVTSLPGSSIVCDALGNIYLAEYAAIRKIAVGTGIISRFAGTYTPGNTGNGPIGGAAFADITTSDLSLGVDGNLYITQSSDHIIRKIDVATNTITWFAGSGVSGYYGGDGPFTANTVLTDPWGMAFDANNNLYVACPSLNRVFRLDLATQQITTVAGTGVRGFSGDNGPASQAALNNPLSVAVDEFGWVYIADQGNNRIRLVSPSGMISTMAGTGLPTFNGDNLSPLSANISPLSIVITNYGILFSESFTPRIRKLAGTVTTIVGNGTNGSSGDGGLAINATMRNARSLFYKPSNHSLYIAETFSNVIRKVDMDTGIISRIAGTGEMGFSGDGGQGLEAKLYVPASVVVLESGDILIADTSNDRIRLIGKNGHINTVAGTGQRGFDGDGIATSFKLSIPRSLAVNQAGEIYFSESNGNKIRKIDLVTALEETTPEADDVTLFPIPVKTTLTVSSSRYDIESVDILSSTGSPVAVFQVNGRHANIDFRDYPSGVYFVRTKRQAKVSVKKVIRLD